MVPNGWEVRELNEICSKTISYGIVQTGPEVANGIPCIRVVDLSKKHMNTSDMIKTSEKIHQSYKKTILEKDELVMALRGEIGLVRIIEDDLSGINITRGIARLAPKKNWVVPDFLLWAMRSYEVKKDLSRKSGGSALQEISLTALRKVKITLPPLPEQRRIAAALSDTDALITALERLIAKKRAVKQGAMQESHPAAETAYCINYFDEAGIEALKEYWLAHILDDEALNAKIQAGDVQLFMDSLEISTEYGCAFWCDDMAEEFLAGGA